MNSPCTVAPPRQSGPTFSAALVAGLLCVLHCLPLHAATATLRPNKDNTLYGNGTANLSNGAGSFLFAGTSGEKRVLRSLVRFDIGGSIPTGARINSVTLTLTINTPKNFTNTVQLHRVLADWGEGTSIAPMGGGGGAAATTGDATWNARFFNTALWATPGGDFSPTISASQRVSGLSGTFAFTSAGMTADVQAWVDNPNANFGWILVAQDEAGPAVRFGSRESAQAPSLVVDFTAGGGGSAPVLTLQPTSQTVTAGATVTLSVAASGTPTPTFQWQKNGATIAGATNATLTLINVTTADAGAYTVIASNSGGNTPSAAATLTVSGGGAVTARLSNLSVRAAMATDQTLIVGFAVSGGSRSMLVRGVGPTLARFGLPDAMTDPRLELYSSGTVVAQNDNWGTTATLSNAFSIVGAFALLPGSNDAAFLQTIGGPHSVHLKGTGAGVALVELYDSGSGSASRLVNVSARNQVGTGDNILIVGFVVAGTGTENLLIRAVGPRLLEFGVTGVLVDPKFEVFRAEVATAIAGNDNWDNSLAATFSSVGAFSLTSGSRDAALVIPLTPGAYTVQVSGVNNGTGEALVEIYELP
ncbi:MAG: DNRLRE domain-containing protein [Opitutaceae bacterium]|nr:DNRLRE domain-containing protein [Opitutaceae bacterium]